MPSKRHAKATARCVAFDAKYSRVKSKSKKAKSCVRIVCEQLAIDNANMGNKSYKLNYGTHKATADAKRHKQLSKLYSKKRCR